MKVYGKIESKIFFIDEEDRKEFFSKYQKDYSINILDSYYFSDGNILKIEILKSRFLKKYEDIFR